MKLTSFLLAAGAAAIASAQTNHTRCGSEHIDPAQAAQLDTVIKAASENGGFMVTEPANISVFAHVVTSAAKEGRYTQEQIDDQIEYINKAYAPLGLNFNLNSTDFTVNDSWASATNDVDAKEWELKKALKKGSYREIDMFFLSDIPKPLGGWSYFPYVIPTFEDVILDGVVVHAGSLPGGEIANHNLGATAVHEIGHWLGLFHPFQPLGFCTGPGDRVDDTPPQSEMTRGCPEGKDSCPGGGVDSIHNWMDYSYDECRDSFTPGQIDRATTLFAKLRVSYAV